MARQREVPIPERGMWTVPDFAAYLGMSDETIYRKIRWSDDEQTVGYVELPLGVNVPIGRDAYGWAVIYRRSFEAAVDRAPTVHVQHWTGLEAVPETEYTP